MVADEIGVISFHGLSILSSKHTIFMLFQAKRLPMVTHAERGSFYQGSWIGEMQQASDKSVIISEILDPRTKNLLSMSKISDYVLSNELVSMALAMVAEDRQINDVLEELFAEEVFVPFFIYDFFFLFNFFLITMLYTIPYYYHGRTGNLLQPK